MKTHWRKLDNPNYLGAYSLMDGNNKDLTVTIEKVVMEEVKSERGSETCKVMYLKGQKPMILNATNSRTIEAIYETPFIEDWSGKQITVYVAKIKAFGEQVDCLRIRKRKPVETALPELTPDHNSWNSVITALKGDYSMEQVKSKFRISKENEKLLNEAKNETI